MGKLLFFAGTAMIICLYYQWGMVANPKEIHVRPAQEVTDYKLANTIGCAPGNAEEFTDDALSIPLLPGQGNHQFNVSTESDSARLYFNQGIIMYYGFHFIEARASFKKAQQFDSACVMAYLGEVLAYGPTINNPAYKQRAYFPGFMEKASRNNSRWEGFTPDLRL